MSFDPEKVERQSLAPLGFGGFGAALMLMTYALAKPHFQRIVTDALFEDQTPVQQNLTKPVK